MQYENNLNKEIKCNKRIKKNWKQILHAIRNK